MDKIDAKPFSNARDPPDLVTISILKHSASWICYRLWSLARLPLLSFLLYWMYCYYGI